MHFCGTLQNITFLVPYPACDEAFFCRLHSESALLAAEDSKSKPQLVSPMFKGTELQSMHVIEIIKNGYTPTEHPEPTVL